MQNIDLNNLFPIKTSNFSKDEVFDIAIIGAGVVGCAIFKEFCENGAKTVLVEKENDILEGASKGNSAIMHTGFDAPPQSLELQCVKRGYAEYMKIKDKLNLPMLNTKAMVVAWDNEQLEKLDGILQKGLNNGISRLDMISDKQIFQKEPHLSKEAKGAILVHGESVIDAWSTPLAYIKQGIRVGGKTAFSHKVEDGHFTGEHWELKTSQKTIKAKTIINAAGLYGDIVDSIKGSKEFKIIPRKGQFIIYDSSAYDLVNSIILPVPTKITKGVVITKTAFGKLLVGPTAEDQNSRDNSITIADTLKKLEEKAIQIIPKIKNHKIIATFAGLRPASDESFYRVGINKDKNWITVGGIRSTGLTASLGLAKHVFELNDTKYEKPKTEKEPAIVPNISEFATRDYEKKGYDKIVCHCEHVTKREILNACRGEFRAGTLGGLKRRTRATMGRCQGFDCLASVSQVCEETKSQS